MQLCCLSLLCLNLVVDTCIPTNPQTNRDLYKFFLIWNFKILLASLKCMGQTYPRFLQNEDFLGISIYHFFTRKATNTQDNSFFPYKGKRAALGGIEPTTLCTLREADTQLCVELGRLVVD